MTHADELMALAGKAAGGKWTVEFGNSIMTGVTKRAAGECSGPNMKAIANADDLDFTEKDVKANAAFIAAACNFVRSDAFRAMARDAERLDFYTENQHRIAKSGGKWCAIIGESSYAFFDTAREAIDAAASGAGE